MLFLIIFMNKMLFFIIFLLLMTGFVGYSYFRTIQLINFLPTYGLIAYKVLFIVGTVAFFYRMFAGESGNLTISYFSGVVGFTWFVIIIWLLLFFAVADISLIILKVAGIWRKISPELILKLKPIVASTLFITISVALTVGYINFKRVQIKELNLVSNTTNYGKSVKMVMASDLHMSSYIGKQDVKRFVKLINRQNPQLVLFAGDLADRSLRPLEMLKLGEELKKISADMGVFAVPGNHESYGGSKESLLNYYEQNGVKVLRDSVVQLDENLILAGRDDRSNSHREGLDSLLNKCNDGAIILLDHQPYNLHESENRVALQLSGHTHKGQFWPATFIVNKMYEKAYGYLAKGKTHYYISSGLGIWGPKIRLGSKSELVVINLKY